MLNRIQLCKSWWRCQLGFMLPRFLLMNFHLSQKVSSKVIKRLHTVFILFFDVMTPKGSNEMNCKIKNDDTITNHGEIPYNNTFLPFYSFALSYENSFPILFSNYKFIRVWFRFPICQVSVSNVTKHVTWHARKEIQNS